MRKINIDNLNIDKGFRVFIESLRQEVDHLLNDGYKENIPVTISLSAQWYDFKGYDPMNSPQNSCIVWAAIDYNHSHFTISDVEFLNTGGDKEKLFSLANVRFKDSLFSIECLREIQFEILRRSDSEWKTPDCFLH